jgi:hypothetical protein
MIRQWLNEFNRKKKESNIEKEQSARLEGKSSQGWKREKKKDEEGV